MAFISLTPIMKSDTSPAPYRTVYSPVWGGNHYAYLAFNNCTVSTSYSWASNTVPPCYLGLDFSTPIHINAVKMRLRYNYDYNYDTRRAPIDYAIQASPDGVTWITLKQIVNDYAWVRSNYKIVTFDNRMAYRYYRIYVTRSAGDCVTLSDVHFGIDVKMLIKDNGLKTIKNGLSDLVETEPTIDLLEEYGFDDLNKLLAKRRVNESYIKCDDIIFKHNYKMACAKMSKKVIEKSPLIDIGGNSKYAYPSMVSEHIPEGAVARSSYDNGGPWQAFTLSGNYWIVPAYDTDHWLVRASTEKMIVNTIRMTIGRQPMYYVTGFTVSGSADGDEFEELYSVDGIQWEPDEVKEFPFNNTKPYNSYKFTFTRATPGQPCEFRCIDLMFDEQLYVECNGDSGNIDISQATVEYRGFIYFDRKYYIVNQDNELEEVDIDNNNHKFINKQFDVRKISPAGFSIYDRLPDEFEIRVLHANDTSVKIIVSSMSASPLEMLSDDFEIIASCQEVGNPSIYINADMTDTLVVQKKPIDLSFINSDVDLRDMSIKSTNASAWFAMSLDEGKTWCSPEHNMKEIDIYNCNPSSDMSRLQYCDALHTTCAWEFIWRFNQSRKILFAFYMSSGGSNVARSLDSVAATINIADKYTGAIKHTDYKYTLDKGTKLRVQLLTTGSYLINYAGYGKNIEWGKD